MSKVFQQTVLEAAESLGEDLKDKVFFDGSGMAKVDLGSVDFSVGEDDYSLRFYFSFGTNNKKESEQFITGYCLRPGQEKEGMADIRTPFSHTGSFYSLREISSLVSSRHKSFYEGDHSSFSINIEEAANFDSHVISVVSCMLLPFVDNYSVETPLGLELTGRSRSRNWR